MPELALHILDLVQNSVSAGATRVVVTICFDQEQDALTIVIEDDGQGHVRGVSPAGDQPVYDLAHTRKVGLGIPCLRSWPRCATGTSPWPPRWARERR